MKHTQDEPRFSGPARTRLAGCVVIGILSIGWLTMLGGCPSGGEPGANEVFMRAFSFDPPEITINAGESVTWTNMDLVPHTATSGNPGDDDLGDLFKSALLLGGQSFSHTFDEAGEFIYYCEVHPVMMRGAKVIVAEEE